MASSPLPFPFPPTTTSYRAGAIFKFEMCQLAPRHPVLTAAFSKLKLKRFPCPRHSGIKEEDEEKEK